MSWLQATLQDPERSSLAFAVRLCSAEADAPISAFGQADGLSGLQKNGKKLEKGADILFWQAFFCTHALLVIGHTAAGRVLEVPSSRSESIFLSFKNFLSFDHYKLSTLKIKNGKFLTQKFTEIPIFT